MFDKNTFVQSIAKTGFNVSLISYGFFWMMDLLRPGFVSRTFSVHLFLLSAIVFGMWWGMTVKEYTDRPWIQMLTAIILGIFLSVITWNLGESFGALRVIVCAFTLMVPFLFWRLLLEK